MINNKKQQTMTNCEQWETTCNAKCQTTTYHKQGKWQMTKINKRQTTANYKQQVPTYHQPDRQESCKSSSG